MVKSSVDQLCTHEDEPAKWDYMILDVRSSAWLLIIGCDSQEGHNIKNPDIQISQCVRRIPAKNR